MTYILSKKVLQMLLLKSQWVTWKFSDWLTSTKFNCQIFSENTWENKISLETIDDWIFCSNFAEISFHNWNYLMCLRKIKFYYLDITDRKIFIITVIFSFYTFHFWSFSIFPRRMWFLWCDFALTNIWMFLTWIKI